MEETIKATGQLTVTVRDARGRYKSRKTFKNLVVTLGKGFIASRMVGASQNVMSHMAIGTGSTAAAASDTALGTEVARVALTSSTASGNQVTYSAAFPAGTPATLSAITEAGILNNSTGGTMMCRSVFAAVNKDTGDSLSINWTVTIN